MYFLTHPFPDEIGDVQKALSVHESGSFILQVRNPTSNQNAPGVGLHPSKRAEYPEEVIEENFGGSADGAGTGRKFVAPNPVGMLDFQGTEVLIIPEKHDADEVLDDTEEAKGSSRNHLKKRMPMTISTDLESAAKREASRMSAEDVLKELRLDEETFPCDALEGDWV